MKRPEPSLPLDDPRLLAFLPMLYVAWADGELSSEETRTICSRVDSVAGLDRDCRSALGRWLDPEHPPSAADLQRLLAAIRRADPGLSGQQRLSLSRFGLELARAGRQQVPAAERRALEELERALGIAGAEATRRFLAAPPEPPAAEPPPEFEPAAMNGLLEPDHRDLRRRLRQTLSGKRFAYLEEPGRAAYREQVLEWCRHLAAEGYGALGFPSRYGGGGDPGAFLAAFETLALHDLSLLVKFGVQFGLFGGSILQLGSERHHAAYLERVGRLELPGCFAMTETGHGSNVQGIETGARYDPERNEFEIHTPHPGARKDYIGNAALHGRLATVFARLRVGEAEQGVHAFLVPIRDEAGRALPGVAIEDCGGKMGLEGVDNGRLSFDHVRIPAANLLDRFGRVEPDGTYRSPIASPGKRFFTMLGTLVGGRVSIAQAGLAAARSALTIAIRYGSRRRQFGPPGAPEILLLDYLTHQRRLLPRLATTYALAFALRRLAARYLDSTAEDRRQIETAAAGLKAYSTWHATETIQACREACGGQGYLSVNRLAALKADTDVFTTFEGDNTVLLQLVAKALLTGFRRQFEELDILGLARYLAGEAASALVELNPVATRRSDPAHLRDPEFQLAALRFREEHLVSTLGRRLGKRLERGVESFQALLECQDHALAAAKAHVERTVLEQFQEAIEGVREPSLSAVLGGLRDLYALSRIEADRGWFLEHRYLAGSKAKAIRKEVNRLCRETRRHALPLVDAFGIPDACLAAPIARSNPPV